MPLVDWQGNQYENEAQAYLGVSNKTDPNVEAEEPKKGFTANNAVYRSDQFAPKPRTEPLPLSPNDPRRVPGSGDPRMDQEVNAWDMLKGWAQKTWGPESWQQRFEDLGKTVNVATFGLLGPKVSPEEGLRIADELVMNQVGTGGLSGMFVGRFPRKAVETALQMEKDKKSPWFIKMFTGMERAADGKWRYEIADNEAAINFNRLGRDPGTGHRAGNLSDILKHPQLFKIYPELKEVGIVVDPKPDWQGLAIFDKRTNSFHFNEEELKKMTPDDALKTILHESQHWIQDKHDFGSGGAPRMMGEGGSLEAAQLITPEFASELQRWQVMDKGIDEAIRKGIAVPDSVKKEFEEVSKQINRYMGRPGYRRLMGEVEARNVEKRLNMTESERRASLSKETEDVPRDLQIDDPYKDPNVMRMPSSDELTNDRSKLFGTTSDFLAFFRGKPNEIEALKLRKGQIERDRRAMRKDNPEEQLGQGDEYRRIKERLKELQSPASDGPIIKPASDGDPMSPIQKQIQQRERHFSVDGFKKLLADKKIRPASIDDMYGTHHKRPLVKHPNTGDWFVYVNEGS